MEIRLFYGTKWFYKLLYFITAMSPAYIIFLIQLHYNFSELIKFTCNINGSQIKIDFHWILLLLIIILISLMIILRYILVKQHTNASTNPVLPPQEDEFKEEELLDINGGVVSFLLGNILPAVFIIEENLLYSILIFLFIQISIYIIIVRSTDIFPNIGLILLGMNLCKTFNDNYIFTFRSKKFENLKVYQLGTPNKSRIYITMYKM